MSTSITDKDIDHHGGRWASPSAGPEHNTLSGACAAAVARWLVDYFTEGLNVDRNLRRRFWFEATSSSASAVLLGATLVWPDWIELAFGVDPDSGSGLLEWLIVLVAFTVLLGASTLARREWRRSLALGAPGAPAPGSSGQV